MSGFADLSEPVRVAGALLTGFGITFAILPYVRRLAVRTDFYDRPVGYKKHAAPTPYLGGLAVMAGILVAGAAFGGALDEYAAVLACGLVLCALGMLDDRRGLGVTVRLSVQVAVAVVVWASGFGWQFLGEAGDLALTIFWIVGLINAFNLMDNLDGAAGTVAGVSAVGAGAFALIESQPLLAALAFSIAGACAAFLRYNLANPARIFLGDGGSMPLGFLIAVVVASAPAAGAGWGAMLALVPITGLVILDTTLVVISRSRRGAPILSGGRDHLTHRLLDRLGSPRSVALTLAIAQGLLCALALGLNEVGETTATLAAAVYVAVGLLTIWLLEIPRKERIQPSEQSA